MFQCFLVYEMIILVSADLCHFDSFRNLNFHNVTFTVNMQYN